MLRQIDILVAVWDGKPPKAGGTGAVVREAAAGGIPVVWLSTEDEAPPRLITRTPTDGDPQAAAFEWNDTALTAVLAPDLAAPERSPAPNSARAGLERYLGEHWKRRSWFTAYDALRRVARGLTSRALRFHCRRSSSAAAIGIRFWRLRRPPPTCASASARCWRRATPGRTCSRSTIRTFIAAPMCSAISCPRSRCSSRSAPCSSMTIRKRRRVEVLGTKAVFVDLRADRHRHHHSDRLARTQSALARALAQLPRAGRNAAPRPLSRLCGRVRPHADQCGQATATLPGCSGTRARPCARSACRPRSSTAAIGRRCWPRPSRTRSTGRTDSSPTTGTISSAPTRSTISCTGSASAASCSPP